MNDALDNLDFEYLLQQLKLKREIFIDMDQTSELNYLLRLVNYTTDKQYNFSEATALSLIHQYMTRMYTITQPTTVALICLYIPVFLFSLGGNSLIIFVVFRNRHMRRVKNMFLVNLAFADLLVTMLCMPMVVGQIISRLWIYGDLMCKMTGYLQGVAVTSSIFTMTGLSIDRYLAIKAPMSTRRLSCKSQAARVMVFIWVLAAIFTGPVLYARRVQRAEFQAFHITLSYCTEYWPHGIDRQVYGVFLLVLTYLLPLVIITICYSLIGRTLCSEEFHRKISDASSTVMSGRKRVARMLVALIVIFMVGWLPYNICSLSLDVNHKYADTHILPFTLLFAHAHSAVNPFIYWFLNRNFRHCMRRALSWRCSDHQDSPQSPHRSGDRGRMDFGDIFRLERYLHRGPATPRVTSPPIMRTTSPHRHLMIHLITPPATSDSTPSSSNSPRGERPASPRPAIQITCHGPDGTCTYRLRANHVDDDDHSPDYQTGSTRLQTTPSSMSEATGNTSQPHVSKLHDSLPKYDDPQPDTCNDEVPTTTVLVTSGEVGEEECPRDRPERDSAGSGTAAECTPLTFIITPPSPEHKYTTSV